MKGFTLSASAKEDLKQIARETQHRWGHSKRIAYLREIDHSFKLLADNPQMGTPCDLLEPPCRKHPVGSHLVFYDEPSESPVHIIRVLHKSMDVAERLGLPNQGTD